MVPVISSSGESPMRTITYLTASAALIALPSCTAPADSTTGTQPAAEKKVTLAQDSVGDFYKNTEYSGASWSPDRQRILVSSNLSGIWNAYAVPTGGGAPQPLTQSTTNSMFAISYFPADERILYSSDEGGNELTHIYVRNPDGSIRDLTPGDEAEGELPRMGWRRQVVLHLDQRARRAFLRPLRDRGGRLQADAALSKYGRVSSSARSRATSVSSRL